MTPENWLSKAIRFDLSTCSIYKRSVYLEARGQTDETNKWVVFMDGWVYGKDADWHYEPLPSSRTDEFINNTRFDTKEEAYYFWRDNVSKKPLII